MPGGRWAIVSMVEDDICLLLSCSQNTVEMRIRNQGCLLVSQCDGIEISWVIAKCGRGCHDANSTATRQPKQPAEIIMIMIIIIIIIMTTRKGFRPSGMAKFNRLTDW